MSIKDIRTHHTDAACDVCGRTLLRGERAETYLNGGTRRSVCELCKSRALEEGWVPEGTLPAYDARQGGSEGRRSVLGRLRRRDGNGRTSAPTLDDELAGSPRAPVPAHAPRAVPARVREPRHVRAVPTSGDQKIAAAVEMFNASEHPRTVSGVARSLGAPAVSILPEGDRPSLVRVVVSWELCWYRYEVDLSDEVSSVRVDGQGYELNELTEPERQPNALADEGGQLYPY